MAQALLDCQITLDMDPATAEDLLETDHGADPAMVLQRLGALLQAYSVKGARVRLRVDSATPSTDTWTIACTQADAGAGDDVQVKGLASAAGQKAQLSVVASGADSASGTFLAGADDTATGANLAAVINNYPPTARELTATAASGTVTITANESGNTPISLATTDASAFAITQTVTGADVLQEQEAVTATITDASIVNSTDALTIGNVTLTYVASASSEDEITNGASNTASAANMATAINAHSKLKGLVTANAAAAVCTITPDVGADRDLATLWVYSEAGNGIALSTNKDHAGTVTFAFQGEAAEYGKNVK